MFDKYLITGATGFLGRAVAAELVRHDAQVRALVLHNDPYISLLPKEVRTVAGDVCDKSSLADFFADADSRTCVIHCAGVVSVASRPGPKLYQVNVGGTWRILRQCMEHDVGRFIYVSSVHAIPEKPEGCVITESCDLSPGLVDGDYAKSKAAATELVFDAAERGLDAGIVFPPASSDRVTYREGVLLPWQGLSWPGGCPLPSAAGMTSWMYGTLQKAFWPVPKAESQARATSCPATTLRSVRCFSLSERPQR